MTISASEFNSILSKFKINATCFEDYHDDYVSSYDLTFNVGVYKKHIDKYIGQSKFIIQAMSGIMKRYL
jgi:hypothetical protein